MGGNRSLLNSDVEETFAYLFRREQLGLLAVIHLFILIVNETLNPVSIDLNYALLSFKLRTVLIYYFIFTYKKKDKYIRWRIKFHIFVFNYIDVIVFYLYDLCTP